MSRMFLLATVNHLQRFFLAGVSENRDGLLHASFATETLKVTGSAPIETRQKVRKN